MSESKLYTPMPPELDHQRLQDAGFTIRGTSPNGPVLAHYDPVRLAGGICYLAGEIWAIYGPIDFGQFVATLGGRQIQMNDSHDLARWVVTCTERPGQSDLN